MPLLYDACRVLHLPTDDHCLPTQFIAAMLLLCRSWSFSSAATHPSVLMASETQQFAWRKDDVEPLAAARACCASEPVFCLETALRAVFWSQTVYRQTLVRVTWRHVGQCTV